MQQATVYKTNALYFTEKLKTKLNSIPNFPLTILEAPMGYGKTTAVRSAFHKTNFKILWHTVYADGISYFWDGFCKALTPLSPDLADSLRKLGLPSDAILVQKAVNLICGVKFAGETVLVIDDYHFVNSPIIDKFISFLLANIPPKLHIVIMSRTAFLSKNVDELRLKGIVNYIGIGDFLLRREDISKYYALCGVTISGEEQKRLFEYSEGWITPLYVSLLEYIECGKFLLAGNVSALVKSTIYNPLREELKEFLNCICVFDSFSIEQAQYMWLKENAAGLLDELMLKNAFISKDAVTGHYSFHNLFISHARDKFALQKGETKNELWERAGYWHLKNREYIQAIFCFDKANNFTLILMALNKERGATITGEHKEKIIEYFDRCPKEMKAENLAAILVFMRFMISYNEVGRLREACAIFAQNIDSFAGTREEKNFLLMEYERFQSLMKYNNIREMSKHHRKAFSYMDTAVLDQENKGNWTFGSPSVLLMFYRESGALEAHVEDMKECMPYYYRLTDGHGSGAEYVMEAEAALNAGKIEKAETIIHKALHYAQEKGQWSILLAASFTQIRIALIRGDYFETVFLKNRIFDLMESKKQYVLLHTLDICESYLYLLLNMPEKTTKWIADGDYGNTRLMFPALPAVHIVYGRYLLLTGNHKKLIGIAGVFLEVARVYPNLISQIYTNIYLAATYHRLAQKEDALAKIKEALHIALPDNIYLPFAENGKYIADLLKQLANEEQYSGHIKEILALYKKSELGIKKIMRENFANTKSYLTKRENDVAVLAARGLSNKAIAKNLMISENTVKSRLKIVFEKLSIKSRMQLEAFLKKNE